MEQKNSACDIEEAHILTETDEVNDFVQVSDSEYDLADSADVVCQWVTYPQNPIYTSEEVYGT